MTLTIARLIGATITVTATTADDAIWLIPYLRSNSGWFHALLFVATLELLVLMCVLASQTLMKVVNTEDEWILGAIGAGFCWWIAAGLFFKKWWKKRKRQQQQQQQASSRDDTTASTTIFGSFESQHQNYGSVGETPSSSSPLDDGTNILPFSPIMVISLTFVGALDELSYFPALLVGGVFSASELCLGTALAAIVILTVVACCLTRCKPLLDCLDQIPLYAVVSTFATIITIETMMDYTTETGDV